MKLIAGLGNPGEKYHSTRHNIGFIVLDHFAEIHKLKFEQENSDWYECRYRIGDENVILIKPVTYMNNSGIAINEFIENYNSQSEIHNRIHLRDILVVVDDFQIPLGSVRVRKKGSDGGHNGLTSIIYHLNSDEFPRMRIGIGSEKPLPKEKFIDFVLGNFIKSEVDIIVKLLPFYSDCILSFIRDGITRTMNKYNKSFLNPEREKENIIKSLKENSD